jgi:hypothetical protein
VPLSRLQTDVLRLLAANRNPESYVAGSSPLNRHAARFSADIDIFHDREESLEGSVAQDVQALTKAGYRIAWKRQTQLIHQAIITKEDDGTEIDWVVDSDYRFFPSIPDELFGYILHPVDLAMNKVMAAAGRRKLRDLVDVLTLHETVLPLGSVAWAAVEKFPGFTPESVIGFIRRNAHYPRDDWSKLAMTEPIDPQQFMPRLLAALDEADAFVAQMPTDKAGLLFLENGKVVQPDPQRLDDYQTHAGARRGHWPSSFEIETAMLDHYPRDKADP